MYRVMLVDDEPFILDGLSETVDWASFGLELCGRAENGKQALEQIAEIPVDILITDITMPVMNGLELIRRARDLRPEMLVIILSGYNEFDYLREGMQLGIENYLLKPVNFAELFSTLRTTVQKLNDSTQLHVIKDEELDIIKDNLMLRMMTNQIESVDFAERAAVLKIEMKGNFVTSIIVRTEPEDANRLWREVKLRREQAMDDKSCIVFRNHVSDTIIVCLGSRRDQCRDLALEIIDGLCCDRDKLPPFRISLGRTEELGYQALSYESAQRAQQCFLLLPTDAVADYEQFFALPDNEAAQLEVNWESYNSLIAAKDLRRLLGRIEEDFQRIREKEGTTPEQVRGLALELMMRLKLSLDDYQRPRGQLAGPFQSKFEQAAQAQDMAELMSVVKEAATLTIEEIVSEDKSPIIQQLLHHIEEHYAEDMTLKMLGQRYHIHPVYLGKLFHQETGETFTEYINRFRIVKARELLRETHLKVNEIARMVGYWEMGYFYKQFRKYVGISPKDYKGSV